MKIYAIIVLMISVLFQAEAKTDIVYRQIGIDRVCTSTSFTLIIFSVCPVNLINSSGGEVTQYTCDDREFSNLQVKVLAHNPNAQKRLLIPGPLMSPVFQTTYVATGGRSAALGSRNATETDFLHGKPSASEQDLDFDHVRIAGIDFNFGNDSVWSCVDGN